MLDFHDLIRPVTLDAFKQDYWEQRPLVVTGDRHGLYDNLLTLADVDELLSISSGQSAPVRVVRDGREIPQRSRGLYGDIGAVERYYAEFRDGATLVLLSLNERWKPLKQLCQSLSELFSAAFQVNVYLTPAHSRGLGPHYDTHDVFVLQTCGSKRWRLYDEPKVLPLPGQPRVGEKSERDESYQEFDLHAGEMIYIPRGWRHEASTGDSTSLHLTIGVYPVTWAMVLMHAMESVIEHDSRFRESLPIGFSSTKENEKAARARLGELVEVLTNSLDPTSLISHAAEGALLGRQPDLDGHLIDLAAASQIDCDSRLRKRPGLPWNLSFSDGRACLNFNGKVVDLPAYLEPQLTFMTTVDDFSAAGLPGDLDQESRLVLVRRLLEEGFLTLCRDTAASDETSARHQRQS